MRIAIIITLIALFTAAVATIGARDIIWNRQSTKRFKLTFLGYIFVLCAFCMVIGPFIQWYFQNQDDLTKEQNQKEETAKHDSTLRRQYDSTVLSMKREYDTSVVRQQNSYQTSVGEQRIEYAASVKHIRRDFGDSNNRTLTVIGQTLAKYKLQLDTAERLIRDSAKTVLPDQPVLDVVTTPAFGNGISFLKFENGYYHYRISIQSQDAASCCYNLKISAVIVDSADVTATKYRFNYKGPVQMLLTEKDNIAKEGTQAWTFPINNYNPYDRLLVWIRGTYSDRNGTYTYHIDKVYYNIKSSNFFGEMGGPTGENVRTLVREFEKD